MYRQSWKLSANKGWRNGTFPWSYACFRGTKDTCPKRINLWELEEYSYLTRAAVKTRIATALSKPVGNVGPLTLDVESKEERLLIDDMKVNVLFLDYNI